MGLNVVARLKHPPRQTTLLQSRIHLLHGLMKSRVDAIIAVLVHVLAIVDVFAPSVLLCFVLQQ